MNDKSNLENKINLLKILLIYPLFNSIKIFAVGGDPLGGDIATGSSIIIGWFVGLATLLFTVNLLLVVICLVMDTDWTRNYKGKVNKALIGTVLFFLVMQLFQNSISSPLQKIQNCPLAVMNMHC